MTSNHISRHLTKCKKVSLTPPKDRPLYAEGVCNGGCKSSTKIGYAFDLAVYRCVVCIGGSFRRFSADHMYCIEFG